MLQTFLDHACITLWKEKYKCYQNEIVLPASTGCRVSTFLGIPLYTLPLFPALCMGEHHSRQSPWTLTRQLNNLTFIDRMAAPTLRRTTFFVFWNHFERTPAEFERTKKYAEYAAAGWEALGTAIAPAELVAAITRLAVRKIAGNHFEQLTGILRLWDSLFFSIFFLTRTSNLKAIIFGSYFPCLHNVVLLCKTMSNLLAIFRAIYEILRSNRSDSQPCGD